MEYENNLDVIYGDRYTNSFFNKKKENHSKSYYAGKVAGSLTGAAAHYVRNVKRDGELWAFYIDKNGQFQEKSVAKVTSNMKDSGLFGNQLKTLKKVNKKKLKAEGAKNIKFKVIYDRSKLRKASDNMKKLFDTAKGEAKAIKSTWTNSRCINVYIDSIYKG
jgi:hypothetical protein